MQNTIYILMRNDDPGPLSDPKKERRVLEIFERYHVPQVLAVIPNNVEDPHVCSQGKFHPLEENPAIIDILKEYQQKGLIEIAQHGYTHQTTKFRPSVKEEITDKEFYQGINRKWAKYDPQHPEGYSEFNGLSLAEQEEKISKGRQYLEKIFDLKLKTFIFPWNSYNKDCLKILRRNGYKFVPGHEDQFIFPAVCVIGGCNWDWDTARFRRLIKKMESLNKPVLTQFAYHSWEISEEFMKELDDLLFELSSMKNVVFITPSQIPRMVPWAPRIIQLRSIMVNLEKEISPYVERTISAPKYYVRDHVYYISRILGLSLALLFLKYLGLSRVKAFRSIAGNYFDYGTIGPVLPSASAASTAGGYAPKV